MLELPNLYADAVNLGDGHKFAGSFCADGVWDVSATNPDWVAKGRGDILSQFEYLRGAHDWVFQLVYQSVIVAKDQSTAQVRTYVGEIGNIRGNGSSLFAVYHDTCRKHDGVWLFQRRKFDPLYHGDPGLSEEAKLSTVIDRFANS